MENSEKKISLVTVLKHTVKVCFISSVLLHLVGCGNSEIESSSDMPILDCDFVENYNPFSNSFKYDNLNKYFNIRETRTQLNGNSQMQIEIELKRNDTELKTNPFALSHINVKSIEDCILKNNRYTLGIEIYNSQYKKVNADIQILNPEFLFSDTVVVLKSIAQLDPALLSEMKNQGACLKLYGLADLIPDKKVKGNYMDDSDDFSNSYTSIDEFLDLYERMVNRYISFFRKAQKGDQEAWSEYSKMMGEIAELSKKGTNIQEKMTTAQLKRYMDININMAKELQNNQ